MKTSYAVVAFLAALILLSSCTLNNEENVESVTVALTTETALEQVTEGTTTAKEILGDYTEKETGVVEIMGSEYYMNEYYSHLTVDADACSEVTAEDIKNIELFESSADPFSYIEVINCKAHDLSFLSELEGFTYIYFCDAEGSDFEYLRNFDELGSAMFVNFGGDMTALVNALANTDIEYASIYARDFSLWEGIQFAADGPRYNKVFTYTSTDEYGSTNAPTDKPYVIAAPCVQSYLEDGKPLQNAIYVEDKLRETGNTLTAYFCNPTDEEVVIDSAAVYDAVTGDWLPMTDGGSYIKLDTAVAPHEELCFELTKDMFDYTAIAGGAYTINFYYGFEGNESAKAYFVLKNSEENEGLDRLSGEQRAVFEKALSYVQEYFGARHI